MVVKKNSTQLNPSHKFNLTQPDPHGLGWVGLNPWVEQFFFITIIIKLSRKNININILKKNSKISINITP